MKRKEIQELKTKPEAELHRLLAENAEKLRKLKFDLAAGKVKDVREIHEVKKGIARMKTFLNQQETA